MRVTDWVALDAEGRRAALARPPQSSEPRLADAVAAIIRDVRREGDAALRRYTMRLDGVDLPDCAVQPASAHELKRRVGAGLRAAIDRAADHIEAFHEAQRQPAVRVETAPGVLCESRSLPIDRVGLYVPGGSAPLVSTVLMLGVPARLAGCRDVLMCTPPGPGGEVDAAIQYAARRCGIRRIHRVGGAQAVAAMAYGTARIPKVDKVFGPGNAWVTEAKGQVARDPAGAAVDLPAGPSEVMVVADASARPEWVAADLLSQLEHGPDSQALLVTPEAALAASVPALVDRQCRSLPRAETVRAALAHSRVIRVADLDQAMRAANAFAPEHLILNVAEPERWADRVRAAGSVFLGAYSPEAAGDYASGTNHVLPTYGWARSVSGLSLRDFQLRISFQTLTRDGLDGLAPALRALARAEGLEAHERAVACRLESKA